MPRLHILTTLFVATLKLAAVQSLVMLGGCMVLFIVFAIGRMVFHRKGVQA